MRTNLIVLLGVTALALSACAQPGVYGPNGFQQTYPCPGSGTNTVVGTAVGAGAGALLGNGLGGRRGRTGRTVAGGLAGALVGGLVGNATEARCSSPNASYGGGYGSPYSAPAYVSPGYVSPGYNSSGYSAPGYGEVYSVQPRVDSYSRGGSGYGNDYYAVQPRTGYSGDYNYDRGYGGYSRYNRY